MACAGEPGHPQYQNGDPPDQVFTGGELLYRRYMADHFQNQQLLPAAFQFPHQSFNREKYSAPEDVLHPECCDGKKLDGWGVLECSATNLPTPIEGPDGRTFQFEPIHKPYPCCYAHTEIWCKTAEGEFADKPSPKVKETFRVKLAQRMAVRKQATV
jgi:hypothetical protein